MPDNGGLLEVISYIDTVQKKYPRLAPFLDTPGVGPLILQLAAGKIEPDEFERRLKNTAYWRKTSEAQRRWKILQYQDPATARARVNARAAAVRDLLAQNGIRLPKNMDASKIARRSLARDWTEEQLNDFVFGFASFGEEGRDRNPDDGSTPPGQYVAKGALGAQVLAIRDLARQYMIDVPPKQVFNNAKKILTGQQTIEGLAAGFAQRALTRWGENQTIAKMIADGGTVADFFDPYRQMIAEELELPADGVDLMQPRFQAILNHPASPGAVDHGGGMGAPATSPTSQFRPMSLTEARTWVRSRPEWNQTRTAESMVSQVGESILSKFGAVA